MESSHQILTDMGIDWKEVYPESTKDETDIIDRYGLEVLSYIVFYIYE